MNRNNALWIPVGIAAVVLITAAGVQAYWTDRFTRRSDSELVQEFAQRLEKVPSVIGDWEAVDHPMDVQEQEVAGIVGYVSREYAHRDSPSRVTVMLVCGNFRNIAKHEPTQCYVAAGYSQEKEVDPYPVETDTSTATFNTTVFKREEQERLERLRVFWSWNYAGEWIAPSNARWSLRGQPALYKLYVISHVKPGEQIEKSDALSFIRLFIPEADRALFPERYASGDPKAKPKTDKIDLKEQDKKEEKTEEVAPPV